MSFVASDRSVVFKWDNFGELRRLNIKSPDDFLYCELIGRIYNIFPSFHAQLAWKDEENDMIVFSTNLELLDALHSNNSNEVIRIYSVPIDNTIRPSLGVGGYPSLDLQQPQPYKRQPCTPLLTQVAAPVQAPIVPETLTPSVLHPNITCDECNGDVVGIRYKCTECHDFDLCMQCERKGLHACHFMVRLVTPVRNFNWSMLPRHVRKSRHHVPRANPQFHNLYRTLTGEPKLDYLSNVGSQIQKALHAFGIDVDASVEHDGKIQPIPPFVPQAAPTPVTPEAAVPPASTPPCDFLNGENISSHERARTPAPKSEEVEDAVKANFALGELYKKACTEMEKANLQQAMIQSESPLRMNDYVMPSAEDDEILSNCATTDSNNDVDEAVPAALSAVSPPQDEWTVVDKEETVEKMLEKPANGCRAGIGYPRQVEPKGPHNPHFMFPHPDRRVQMTVEQVESMGYDNCNGWITRLAEIYNGDIPKIIEEAEKDPVYKARCL